MRKYGKILMMFKEIIWEFKKFVLYTFLCFPSVTSVPVLLVQPESGKEGGKDWFCGGGN